MPYLYFIIVDWSRTFLVWRLPSLSTTDAHMCCAALHVCVRVYSRRERSNNQIKTLHCGKTETDWISFVRTLNMRFVSHRMEKVRTFVRHTQTHSWNDFINPIDGTRNFAAFNKQAIKLTTTYIQDLLILSFVSFHFVLTFIQLHHCKLVIFVFPSACVCVCVFENSIRALYLTRFWVLSKIICFLVQWGENNIDKRSIRIS